ncbi:MAG: M23 family metallopeptidase [bacterium]
MTVEALRPAASAATATPPRRSPVELRPWRVLLVPPTPGAPTRMFNVARWQARVAVALAIVSLLAAGGLVSAVVLALESPDLFSTGAEVTALREQLTAARDSLTLARTALTEGEPDMLDSSRGDGGTSRPNAGDAISTRRPLLAERLSGRSKANGNSIDLSASKSLARIAELPVIGAIVSGFSGARKHPLLHIVRPHLGVDVSAPSGTPITAPAPGRVGFVGRRFAFGLMVEIEHPNGVVTRYAHLREAHVTEGAVVTRGELIGNVGSSGLTTGPHLHYEMIVNGRQVDPLRFRMPKEGDSSVSAQHPGVPVGPSAGGLHEDVPPAAQLPPAPPAR